ncbi:MAG: cobalamin-independent methionine synthase II family protein [Oceanicaulis sp.]
MTKNAFRTTHVGSLPRPDDLIRLMFAKQDGLPLQADVLEARINEAVDGIVTRQIEAGLDFVNDGEMSKPSYATYIQDRLSGFGGSGASYTFQDIEDFPETKRRIFDDPGRKNRRAPACNGPIEVIDMEAPRLDAERLNGALARHEGAKAFMSAASPGVTTLFFGNEYYDSHEDYLFAVAEGLRHEYEAIAEAGIILQIDCPDLAMGRHTQYADLTLSQFRDRMALHIDALNHAVRNIPAEQLRMHMCWGNYPGPHHCDVPFKDIIESVWKAKPSAILFEAANPRHAHEYELFETVKLPEGKTLVPGVIECQSNYIEHPELVAQRIGRYANLVGRDNVIAGVDCGFSIHVGSGGVDPDIVFAKLSALSEGARLASEKFWP